MIGKNVDWNHEQLQAGWILIKDNFNVTIWMEKKTACIWWLKETSFGFENQEVQFFWYTCNRFRLLDTDSGILIQIRFILYYIWYIFRLLDTDSDIRDPFADRIIQSDTRTCNLIQIRFILCYIWYRIMQSDTRTCNWI